MIFIIHLFAAMFKQIPRKQFYNIIPAVVWFLLLVLPFATSPANMPERMHRHFVTHIFIDNSLLLIIFYLHTYLIYPLRQRKIWQYASALAVILACYWVYMYFFRMMPMGPPPAFRIPADAGVLKHNPAGRPPFGPGSGRPGFFFPVISPLIAILCSFCFRVITDNISRQHLLKERETVHLRTELNFLRSQINPHFLFNILNNLTSLARKKSDLVEPAIVNLSQLMRYMLYESDDNKVSILKEIDYLSSYIDLQLLRFGDEVTVKFDLTGEFEHCTIGPMLLISLVENAFKHGAGIFGPTTIFITLKMLPCGQKLYFSVINDVTQTENNIPVNSGIGLKNLHRRLDILYPGKHDLNIIRSGLLFISELTIDLS